MKVIIRAVPQRSACVEYLTARLPDAEVVWDPDPGHGAFGTFLPALELADGEPSLHLEDDITLTINFMAKVEQAIAGTHGKMVVQMFSMRPRLDLTVGSRLEPGRSFMMTQCFYLPPHFGPWIAEHTRAGSRPQSDPGGIDMAVGDFLHANRLRYWLHVPSLVQHDEVPSMLGPRSTRRQSPTFVDAWT